MRVTIDTKHDSLEEIKKVVALLSEMIHKQSGSNSSGSSMLDFNLPAGTSSSADASSGGMMNMFDTPSPGGAKSEETAPAGSLTGVFSGFFNQSTGQKTEQETRGIGETKELAYKEGEAKMEVY